MLCGKQYTNCCKKYTFRIFGEGSRNTDRNNKGIAQFAFRCNYSRYPASRKLYGIYE